MRSETRCSRLAGNRSTGMLTRPKVIVPDQNARARPSSCSWSCSSSATDPPLLRRLDAARQHLRQRAFLLTALDLRELHHFSGSLRLDQLEHALAILILELRHVELSLQCGHQLLRHVDLTLIERTPLRRWQRRDRYDLTSVPECDQHEIAVLRQQRADIILLAHHPARDSFLLR